LRMPGKEFSRKKRAVDDSAKRGHLKKENSSAWEGSRSPEIARARSKKKSISFVHRFKKRAASDLRKKRKGTGEKEMPGGGDFVEKRLRGVGQKKKDSVRIDQEKRKGNFRTGKKGRALSM